MLFDLVLLLNGCYIFGFGEEDIEVSLVELFNKLV